MKLSQLETRNENRNQEDQIKANRSSSISWIALTGVIFGIAFFASINLAIVIGLMNYRLFRNEVRYNEDR